MVFDINSLKLIIPPPFNNSVYNILIHADININD
jgi:hypothetical protein